MTQRQFGFVHEHPRDGEFRELDRVARTDNGVRVLHEHVERPRLALRVLPVVRDRAQDMMGPRQRSAQAHCRQRQRRCGLRELVERRPQPFEIVDDALHHQLRGVIRPHHAGNIDDAALGEQAGQLRAGAFLKQNELHGLPLGEHVDEGLSPPALALRRCWLSASMPRRNRPDGFRCPQPFT
jgi:hypothetical protein